METQDLKVAECGDKMVGWVCLFAAGFVTGMIVFGT